MGIHDSTQEDESNNRTKHPDRHQNQHQCQATQSRSSTTVHGSPLQLHRHFVLVSLTDWPNHLQRFARSRRSLQLPFSALQDAQQSRGGSGKLENPPAPLLTAPKLPAISALVTSGTMTTSEPHAHQSASILGSNPAPSGPLPSTSFQRLSASAACRRRLRPCQPHVQRNYSTTSSRVAADGPLPRGWPQLTRISVSAQEGSGATPLCQVPGALLPACTLFSGWPSTPWRCSRRPRQRSAANGLAEEHSTQLRCFRLPGTPASRALACSWPGAWRWPCQRQTLQSALCTRWSSRATRRSSGLSQAPGRVSAAKKSGS